MNGTIVTLIPDKPFGFIAPEGMEKGQGDVFFHQSAVTGATFADLKEGQKVTYELKTEARPDGTEKTFAANVMLVS